MIERNARREMRLVGDLLALVRIEAGTFSVEPEAIELTEVARQAADAAAPRARAAEGDADGEPRAARRERAATRTGSAR